MRFTNDCWDYISILWQFPFLPHNTYTHTAILLLGELFLGDNPETLY